MMVFISTTSGVEFLYELFSTFKVNQQGVSTSAAAENGDASSDDDDDEEDEGARAASNGTVSQVLGIKIFKLHGDMDQASRSTTYREFASSRVSVLLCTDVGTMLPCRVSSGERARDLRLTMQPLVVSISRTLSGLCNMTRRLRRASTFIEYASAEIQTLVRRSYGD